MRSRLIWIGAPLLLSVACSQLVGIKDTEVTRAGNEAGTGGNGKSGETNTNGGDVVAGKAGNGGGGATGGGGASGGKAGAPLGGDAGAPQGGTTPEGGAGGEPGVCTDKDSRCVASGHEVCKAGVWTADPCPGDTPTCEGNTCIVRGPAMSDAGLYFIDQTEVTVAQYKLFLKAKNGDTTGQPAVCAWNSSYYEAAAEPQEQNLWPVAKVDWCDAVAFCTWADKRLCGAIGGGPVAVDDFFDLSKSQWYLACAGSGGASHPSNVDECNSNGGFDNLAPVGTFPGCEGRVGGVFDLEGNVAEWVDSCSAQLGKDDKCLLAGGNIIDNQSYCSETYDTYARNETAPTFGFRCCSK